MLPTWIITRFAKMQNVKERLKSYPYHSCLVPWSSDGPQPNGWFWWPDAGDDNVSLYLLRLLMLHLNSSWVGIRGKKCPLMGNSWASGSWSLTSRNHRLNITKVAQGAKTDPWCNDTASKLSKWSLVRFTEAFIKYLRLYFLLWSHKWDWVQLSDDTSSIENVNAVQLYSDSFCEAVYVLCEYSFFKFLLNLNIFSQKPHPGETHPSPPGGPR